MTAEQLRREALTKRRALSKEQVAAHSAAIVERLLHSGLLEGASTVLSYLAYGNEVNLAACHKACWQKGLRLAVPVVTDQAAGLMAAALLRPEDMPVLATAALGVGEPRQPQFIAPQEIDLVLAPGVVFDRLGGRLGHGKGFYDRYLPQLTEGVKVIGVGHEMQVAPQVPLASWDYLLDGLCTEQGLSMFTSTRLL